MAEHNEITDAGQEMGRIVRTLMQATARIGEQLARHRARQLEQARAMSAERARELQTRMRTEQAAAEASLKLTFNNRWWDEAGPEQVVGQYQLAHAWREQSPIAAQATEHIRGQVKDRFGVDATAGDDLAAIGALLGMAREDHDLAEREQRRADTDRDAGLALDPDTGEPAAPADPAVSNTDTSVDADERYAGAHRHEQLAEQLHAAGVDHETAAARLLADLNHATGPQDAVAQRAPRRSRPYIRTEPARTKQREVSGR